MMTFGPTAAKLRTLVPSCVVCARDLSKHRFVQVATTIATADNKRRVQEFIRHIRGHEWSALAEYRDFKPDQNSATLYAILGPHNNGMVVLIRDPFELYEPGEVYLQESVSTEELSTLVALAGRDWQDL